MDRTCVRTTICSKRTRLSRKSAWPYCRLILSSHTIIADPNTSSQWVARKMQTSVSHVGHAYLSTAFVPMTTLLLNSSADFLKGRFLSQSSSPSSSPSTHQTRLSPVLISDHEVQTDWYVDRAVRFSFIPLIVDLAKNKQTSCIPVFSTNSSGATRKPRKYERQTHAKSALSPTPCFAVELDSASDTRPSKHVCWPGALTRYMNVPYYVLVYAMIKVIIISILPAPGSIFNVLGHISCTIVVRWTLKSSKTDEYRKPRNKTNAEMKNLLREIYVAECLLIVKSLGQCLF